MFASRGFVPHETPFRATRNSTPRAALGFPLRLDARYVWRLDSNWCSTWNAAAVGLGCRLVVSKTEQLSEL